ncbi:MAG: sodium:calcium antiporter [Acidimicrobiia bacterium]
MADIVVMLVGVVFAGLGGELFVRGAVGLSVWARIPAGVIGTTVAAFATSSPEMSVAIQAARSGRPEIALGDALGSNVINIGLVLGVTIALGSLPVERRLVRRELVVAAAAPLLTVAVLIDGTMATSEAVVLAVAFVAWLAVVTREAWRARSAAVEAVKPPRRFAAVGTSIAGLALLMLAGRIIVSAAKGLGDTLGLHPFVVGATLVAAGTSAPELATAVISRRRGHAEVGLGTVLGSNVFNNLAIVALAGLIEPIRIAATDVVIAVVACLVALGLVVPGRSASIPRWRGAVLLAVVAAYTVASVVAGTA